MESDLSGVTVVVTRPAHQAHELSELVTSGGGSVVLFPVIEIQAVEVSEQLQSQLFKLNSADIAIFISANAVETCIAAIGGAACWPVNLTIAAVGRSTAAKLASYGLNATLVAPEPFNTEALLSIPELKDVSAKKVIILRGVGGRELLADTLLERGAEVEYIECYRRVIPDSDPATLYQCWDQKRLLFIVVTSNESLANLVTMVDNHHQQDLLSSNLIVISERAIKKAKQLGFTKIPILADTASNESIRDAILSSAQSS